MCLIECFPLFRLAGKLTPLFTIRLMLFKVQYREHSCFILCSISQLTKRFLFQHWNSLHCYFHSQATTLACLSRLKIFQLGGLAAFALPLAEYANEVWRCHKSCLCTQFVIFSGKEYWAIWLELKWLYNLLDQWNLKSLFGGKCRDRPLHITLELVGLRDQGNSNGCKT
jgi:hypothetical protein